MDAEETSELDEEGEEDELDYNEDLQEENLELNQEINPDYSAPNPEERINQWTVLDTALKKHDTVRTTFLTEGELGRPLFSVRFLMDMHDLSKHFLDSELQHAGLDPNADNIIANYFWNKVQNITGSGMSNKGFAMNLSVTSKRDTTKKRIKEVGNDGRKVKA